MGQYGVSGAEDQSTSQNHEGSYIHAKESGFYPEGDGKVLKDCKQRHDMSGFVIEMGHPVNTSKWMVMGGGTESRETR